MPTRRSTRDRIVDTALELAERDHWERVRLHDIAATLKLSLNDIRAHFREKEDIAEAWFDRADAAMLKRSEAAGFADLETHARIHALIMAWLDALAEHRAPTRQMILGKLEPGHLHVQIPAVLRISRTVQWVREGSGCRAGFVQRALEESVLTTLYLMTFLHWMGDDSPASADTRALLARRLERAKRPHHGIHRVLPAQAQWIR